VVLLNVWLDEEIEAPLVDIDGEQVLLKALLKANSLILERKVKTVFILGWELR